MNKRKFLKNVSILALTSGIAIAGIQMNNTIGNAEVITDIARDSPKVKVVNVEKIKQENNVILEEQVQENKYTYILSENEKKKLYRIVEAETTGHDITSKRKVAKVILNRLDDENFPDTIHDVIFQKHQFSPVSDGRYWEVEITEKTIQAVEEVLKEGTGSFEALYFMNPKWSDSKSKKWFRNNLVLVATCEGHEFYK